MEENAESQHYGLPAMLHSTWDVDHLEALEVLVPLVQTPPATNTYHLFSKVLYFSRKWNFRRKKMFICLWSLRPPQMVERPFPLKLQLGLNKWPASVQPMGLTTWNLFLMEISHRSKDSQSNPQPQKLTNANRLWSWHQGGNPASSQPVQPLPLSHTSQSLNTDVQMLFRCFVTHHFHCPGESARPCD